MYRFRMFLNKISRHLDRNGQALGIVMVLWFRSYSITPGSVHWTLDTWVVIKVIEFSSFYLDLLRLRD